MEPINDSGKENHVKGWVRRDTNLNEGAIKTVSAESKTKHRSMRGLVQERIIGKSNLPNWDIVCSGSSNKIVEWNKIKPKYHHTFKPEIKNSRKWRNSMQKRKIQI